MFRRPRATDRLFWIVLAGSFVWRVILAARLGASYDEGYYFFWSLNPQLGYFDHPPLTAWAMTAWSLLFGDSIWAVRATPLIAGTLIPVLGRALARRMFAGQADGPAAANRAGMLLTLMPVLAGNGLLMTPDVLLALGWIGALACAWLAGADRRGFSPWWAAVGICAGVGMLSKYTMVLFFLGLGVWWLLEAGRRRRIFLGSAAAGALALVLFSPVIYWNATHDWISFRFQLGHGLGAGGDPFYQSLGDYLGGLLVIASPGVALLAVGLGVTRLRSADPRLRFLAAHTIAALGFFAFSALRKEVEPNWPMPALLAGALLVGRAWPELNLHVRRATALALLLPLAIAAGYLTAQPWLTLRIGDRALRVEKVREFFVGRPLVEQVRRLLNEHDLYLVSVRLHQDLGQIAFYAPELRDRVWLCKLGRERFPWIDLDKWAGRSGLALTYSPKLRPGKGHFGPNEFLGIITVPDSLPHNRIELHAYAAWDFAAQPRPDPYIIHDGEDP